MIFYSWYEVRVVAHTTTNWDTLTNQRFYTGIIFRTKPNGITETTETHTAVADLEIWKSSKQACSRLCHFFESKKASGKKLSKDFVNNFYLNRSLELVSFYQNRKQKCSKDITCIVRNSLKLLCS